MLLFLACTRNYDESLKILVTKNESSTQEELWTMDFDGKNEKQLTSFALENRCTQGSWSQNGKTIVYLQYDSVNFSKLMIMDSNGNNKKLIATDSTGFQTPSFFSDNKRIAVSVQSITAPYFFYIIDTDTGTKTTLSTNEFQVNRMSVSSDGTIMMSEPSSDGGYQLWNEKTGLSSLVVPAGLLTFSHFSWNSDGKLLALFDSTLGLLIYNPSTQTTSTVLSTVIIDTIVSWDPSSEYIFFSSASGIQKIKPDGTNIQTVNSNPLYTQPQIQFKTM